MIITPYHPVRIEGKWKFPIDINHFEERDCDAVYSFILDDGHVMVINGVECVSMGHGFTHDDVVKHEFFGT